MRKARLALLGALVLTIAVVVAGYYASQKRNQAAAPPPPPPLAKETSSTAANWSWAQSVRNRPVVEARARDFRQARDSSRFELGEVELKIYRASGSSYDLVRSRKAEFDQAAERLYSDGEVTIVLGLPAGTAPAPGQRYVEILTSGLTYDNKTGVASTDRPAQFVFEEGEGRSVGAVYDSAKRYLWMKSEAEVTRLPEGTSGAALKIRAGELHYYEAEQKIDLAPWASLERGPQGVKAAAATVFLENGSMRRVEAHKGQGWDRGGGREVEFAGDWIEVVFTATQTLERATGIGGAEFASRTAAGGTRIQAGRVDLEFATPAGAQEAHLTTALALQQVRLERVPEARAAAETKVLTAEALKLTMRPGGEDIQTLETLAAGRLEILPRQPGQWKRTLSAQRMSAQYLPGNRLENLRAFGAVEVRSEPPQAGAPPRLSWSEDLEAVFDPATGQMRELRQWSGFRYQEGARQARAEGARFEMAADRVHLTSAARVWDESTQTAADSMVLDQENDRFEAEGRVSSTHQPSAQKPPAAGRAAAPEALFASDRPLHATAHRMESADGGRRVRYRGSARLWQDGNSVQAEQIDLDRGARTLDARGNVRSVLVEEADTGRKAAAPRLITIAADSLAYTDENRRAWYSGNANLERGLLTVRSMELEAFLRPRDSTPQGQSRLERALAAGRVEIVESGPAARRGSAEQAEYLTGDERVSLRGGSPTIQQPGRGATEGAILTYYINRDRLEVRGASGAPSRSRMELPGR